MFSADFWEKWLYYFNGIIYPSIGATLRMTAASMFFGSMLGFGLAALMVLYRDDGLRPNKKIYSVLSFFTNTVRSFPIIILIVAISPITRLVVGTSIGERAAIFPLTIAAAPFMARIIESSFIGVNKQLIEAAQSFGATDSQIIFGVMLKESVPSLVSGLTLGAINFLTATTLAGAVGAGGIGAVALNYGYQNFNNMVLYTAVILLMIFVQLLQYLGNLAYHKLR